ncbi:MAG TPA: hypothetical protein VFS43_47160 [Polyangiaceae bacterium]|nr:hypothetical protein [Polyangiaceae bacterium]
MLSPCSLDAPRPASSGAARQLAAATFYEAALERAWDESPQSLLSDSLELAEQLLHNAERSADEGDLSAACLRARRALEGLTVMPEGGASTDGALRALRARAKHDLDRYEARRNKASSTGRN